MDCVSGKHRATDQGNVAGVAPGRHSGGMTTGEGAVDCDVHGSFAFLPLARRTMGDFRRADKHLLWKMLSLAGKLSELLETMLRGTSGGGGREVGPTGRPRQDAEGGGKRREGGGERPRRFRRGAGVRGEAKGGWGKSFPMVGKLFSNRWKMGEKLFQSLEKSGGIFQSLESFFPIIGKLSGGRGDGPYGPKVPRGQMTTPSSRR